MIVALACGPAACDDAPAPAGSAPAEGRADTPRAVEEPRALVPLCEFDGAIRHVVIHAPQGRIQYAWRAMHDLLAAMPADVRFTFVCDTGAAQEELNGRLRQWKFDARGNVVVRLYGKRVSIWARDRYIATQPVGPGRAPVWLTPQAPMSFDRRRRLAEGGIPEFLNTQSKTCDARETRLVLDGGNVLCDGARVLLGSNVLIENRRAGDASALRGRLSALFGLPVVLVPSETAQPPIRHLDLFMTVVGAGRAVVGSPALAREAMAGADEASRTALRERLFAVDEPAPGGQAIGPDLSDARCALFDDVARSLEVAGFAVTRMPYADSRGGDFIVGYCNVIQEHRDGRHIVYMPVYGIPALDAAARAAWEALGCEVRPIDVSSMCHLLGAVRCLANVVERS